MSTIGYGPSRPIADNNTDADHHSAPVNIPLALKLEARFPKTRKRAFLLCP